MWPRPGSSPSGSAVRAEADRFLPVKPVFNHPWELSPEAAAALQKELAARVIQAGRPDNVRLVAGVDLAAGRHNGQARAAVVLLDYPGLEVRQVAVAEGPLTFPYIPGLLSFRETPLILRAFEQVAASPDLIFVDGQGIAHPRRFGIACHIGVLFDLPTIGVAKSWLIWREVKPAAPGPNRGDRVVLQARDGPVGAAVRTQPGAAPVYVSVGHRVDLQAAVDWTLACVRDHRLPEPTRLADLASRGRLGISAQLGLW